MVKLPKTLTWEGIVLGFILGVFLTSLIGGSLNYFIDIDKVECNKERKPHYTSLEVWGDNPDWMFEHLWWENSFYDTAIYKDERYSLKFANYEKDIVFDMIFNFKDESCSIRFYNVSCPEEFGYDECFTKYKINGEIKEVEL